MPRRLVTLNEIQPVEDFAGPAAVGLAAHPGDAAYQGLRVTVSLHNAGGSDIQVR